MSRRSFTISDAVSVLETIESIWPYAKNAERTPAEFSRAFGEYTRGDVENAVRRLAKSKDTIPSFAEIRREITAARPRTNAPIYTSTADDKRGIVERETQRGLVLISEQTATGDWVSRYERQCYCTQTPRGWERNIDIAIRILGASAVERELRKSLGAHLLSDVADNEELGTKLQFAIKLLAELALTRNTEERRDDNNNKLT